MFDVRTDLDNCPACGAETVAVSDLLRTAFSENLDDDRKAAMMDTYIVRCEDGSSGGCGCATPPFNSVGEAIKDWNSSFNVGGFTIEGGLDAVKALS